MRYKSLYVYSTAAQLVLNAPSYTILNCVARSSVQRRKVHVCSTLRGRGCQRCFVCSEVLVLPSSNNTRYTMVLINSCQNGFIVKWRSAAWRKRVHSLDLTHSGQIQNYSHLGTLRDAQGRSGTLRGAYHFTQKLQLKMNSGYLYIYMRLCVTSFTHSLIPRQILPSGYETIQKCPIIHVRYL